MSSPGPCAIPEYLSSFFFRFFEQHPEKYPAPGGGNLVIGVGLGQLSAAAVSCSKTIADLFGPAVEAIHLAFRVGAVVERFSSSSRQTDVDEGYWNITVDGSVEEIESELQTCQDQMVWLNHLFSVHVLSSRTQVIAKGSE